MFCKLKNWRRIAAGYDRHAQSYLSGLALAAIMGQWILMSPQPNSSVSESVLLPLRCRTGGSGTRNQRKPDRHRNQSVDQLGQRYQTLEDAHLRRRRGRSLEQATIEPPAGDACRVE